MSLIRNKLGAAVLGLSLATGGVAAAVVATGQASAQESTTTPPATGDTATTHAKGDCPNMGTNSGGAPGTAAPSSDASAAT